MCVGGGEELKGTRDHLGLSGSGALDGDLLSLLAFALCYSIIRSIFHIHAVKKRHSCPYSILLNSLSIICKNDHPNGQLQCVGHYHISIMTMYSRLFASCS